MAKPLSLVFILKNSRLRINLVVVFTSAIGKIPRGYRGFVVVFAGFYFSLTY
jgi:hypothetical protein